MGNPAYRRFATGVGIVATRLNLMELYYGLLLLYGKAQADAAYARLVPYCVDFGDDLIKGAMLFRAVHKKGNLSYVDCIGYVLARKRSIPFLTGDRAFEHLENVEVVK